jgi:peptidoglycan/xylan/chitin deacetylase (PgdA/CDA1 family)
MSVCNCLFVEAPGSYIPERQYVLDFIFGELLGLDIHVTYRSQAGMTNIRYGDKVLSIVDTFLATPGYLWLSPGSLPEQPLSVWNFKDVVKLSLNGLSEIPILFGDDPHKNSIFQRSENKFYLGLDIFGSSFFMLSRYEELVKDKRDKLERFQGCDSLAYKENFLDRPIIDEYVEILWHCLKGLWPSLQRKQNQGEILVTCDVDYPFDMWARSNAALLKGMVGGLVRHRSPKLVMNRIQNRIRSISGDYSLDPNYTFDWYMNACETHGRRAAFYFIAGHSAGDIDGYYSLDEQRIHDLLKMISERGHEIGLHGSYNTFRSPNDLDSERRNLIRVCEEGGMDASVQGNRQHYLRWDPTQTADHINAAGFTYDTTGTFADAPGFRYGTSRMFRMWSWLDNAPLNLRQKPLIVMESSVVSDMYLGLGYTEKALDLLLRLKKRSLAYGGDFVFLWHNSHLSKIKDREFFLELIK